jgi:hypothetical protein
LSWRSLATSCVDNNLTKQQLVEVLQQARLRMIVSVVRASAILILAISPVTFSTTSAKEKGTSRRRALTPQNYHGDCANLIYNLEVECVGVFSLVRWCFHTMCCTAARATVYAAVDGRLARLGIHCVSPRRSGFRHKNTQLHRCRQSSQVRLTLCSLPGMSINTHCPADEQLSEPRHC